MFGPVILPLDQAVSALASPERLAEEGIAAEEIGTRTHVHLYAVGRDAAGSLVLGHSSHSSHSSHASHVSSTGGGGVDYGFPTTPVPAVPFVPTVPVVPVVPVVVVPAAPSAVAAAPQDGAANISWTAPISSDGGAVSYTVTSHPGETTITVANATTALFSGLQNGTAYSFTVTATNSAGEGPVSTSTGTVVPVAPQLEGHVPVIVGEPAVGRKLRADAEGWADGTTLAYQWQASGQDIAGAVGPTFRPTADLVGERISVTVAGANPAYAQGAAATSAKTLKVARVGTPKISGKARAGAVLRARTGRWTAGTTFTFTWFVGGKRIRHPGASLPVRPAYAGKTIAVRVTGKRSGYDTFVVTSPRTPKVRS